jgi:Flp pilus assembly protein TadG
MSGRDRGSATVELAAALPALVLLLLAGLTAVGAVTTKAHAVGAARDAALAAARGERAPSTGPPGAVVTVAVTGDTVTATVRVPVRSLGTHLPRIDVTARAVAAREPRATP